MQELQEFVEVLAASQGSTTPKLLFVNAKNHMISPMLELTSVTRSVEFVDSKHVSTSVDLRQFTSWGAKVSEHMSYMRSEDFRSRD